MLKVSILVFVELALGRWYLDYDLKLYSQFQSLFLWNSLSDVEDKKDLLCRPAVSILVFVELALGLTAIIARAAAIMFQSLFLWNSLSDDLDALPIGPGLSVSILVFVELALGRGNGLSSNLTTPCFNPCFCGTRSRTLLVPVGLLSDFHVSILVFVELALGQ